MVCLVGWSSSFSSMPADSIIASQSLVPYGSSVSHSNGVEEVKRPSRYGGRAPRRGLQPVVGRIPRSHSSGEQDTVKRPTGEKSKIDFGPVSRYTPGPMGVNWYVYVLRCDDASLYTGMTNDVSRRLSEHEAGRGGRYTRAHLPVTLVAVWCFSSRQDAYSAEAAFKRLARARKLHLIHDREAFREAPFAHDVLHEAVA